MLPRVRLMLHRRLRLVCGYKYSPDTIRVGVRWWGSILWNKGNSHWAMCRGIVNKCSISRGSSRSGGCNNWALSISRGSSRRSQTQAAVVEGTRAWVSSNLSTSKVFFFFFFFPVPYHWYTKQHKERKF